MTGSASIASSASIRIGPGAIFSVSGLSSTFTLGSGQTLAGNGGTLAGNANLTAGALALNYTSGTPSLVVTNGTLTLNSNAVTVTVSGGALTAGSDKLIAAATSGNAGSVAGIVPANVTVNGSGATAPAALQFLNGELYLVVVSNGSGSMTSAIAVLTCYNTMPVAQVMTATRQAGFSLKISLSDLSTNWSDADGDAVSLTAIGLTTTNGVMPSRMNVTTNLDGFFVTTNTAFLNYLNSNNVADHFDYTIADDFGGTPPRAM